MRLILMVTVAVGLGIGEALTSGAASYALLDAASVAGMLAFGLGLHVNRPTNAGPWWLLGASIPLFAAGGAMYQWVAHWMYRHPGSLLLPQSLFFLGFGTLLAGSLWIGHRMRLRATGDEALDLAILITAVVTVMALLVIRPLLHASDLTDFTRVTTATFPAVDAVIIAGLLRLVWLAGPAPAALWLVAASMTSSMASDLGLAVSATRSAHGGGGPLTMLGFVGAPILMGLAALHPSMAALVDRSEPSSAHAQPPARIWLLWTAVMSCPISVAISTNWIGERFRAINLVLPSAILTTIVLVRLNRMIETASRARRTVAEKERSFRLLIEHQQDHVVVVRRTGEVVYQSPSVEAILGFRGADLLGTKVLRLLRGAERREAIRLASRCRLRPGQTVGGILRAPDARGTAHSFEASLTDLSADPAVGGLVIVLHDVTQRENLENQLRHQAAHDPLTGLANRALLLERTRNMLQWARLQARDVAVLFIDLDNFKHINDTLGHEVGDSVLLAISERLVATMRKDDMIARHGGDEFVALAFVDGPDGDAEAVARRILATLEVPVHHRDGAGLSVTASIGIAVGREDSADELLRAADIAMYTAKISGKNRFAVFEPRMEAAVRARVELEADLRLAVEQGELHVVYQPIIDLGSLRTTGVEALLRWHHIRRGPVPPAAFIPLAEENGLIDEVGRFVLHDACRAACVWQNSFGPLDVSVNLSPRQLTSSTIVSDVARALHATGLPPGRLILEMTEHALMMDDEMAARRLSELKALGVRIALDDFGTGHSSMSHLRQFPIDVLKIDRSFVAAAAESRDAQAILHALVQLGKALKLVMVAEGVETTDQLTALKAEECDAFQGFLFSRPLELRQMHQFLSRAAAGAMPPVEGQRTPAGGAPGWSALATPAGS